ncbi:MAG: hypothetical protein IKZ58_03390 [Selenomonadaceae bacterium]|nr:hypothetical protein [Selenomonadaceae bacterium]
MRKIFLITLAIIFFCTNFVSAANSQNNIKPRLLMAEVESYGNTELKPEVNENFYKIILEVLKSDFNVESRRLVANIGGEPIKNTEIFSTIHMDAIVHGPFYTYDTSNIKLKNYSDSVFGKQHAKSITAKKYDGKPYRLSTSFTSEIKKIGAAYDVDYLFFCNVKDIDAWRRIGSTYGANPNVKNLDGKKIQVNLDYYLIEVKSGKVFTGQISDKKTKLSSNQLSKIFGRNLTVNDMLNYVLTEQALKIEKNISDKGFKAFNSK